MTPDEKFMIKLYEVAKQKGDPRRPINYQSVAKSIGLKETAVKNIVKHLAQANFVKKIDETTLHLTDRGCAFVLEMITS
jgi:Mn-dependent DtxR family transcriptional regulator